MTKPIIYPCSCCEKQVAFISEGERMAHEIEHNGKIICLACQARGMFKDE